METYRTFHRGFVVYSMWTDTCEKQYYAQKKKKAFHCCFYLPPQQRLRMRISDKVFYLFSVQTMWSIFLRILSLRLQKAFEVPYKQKKISSTVWKWQSSVKISGWVLTFAEPCFIRNFFGKICVWSLANLSAMVTESSEGNETLNTAVITTDLLFRLSRCRLYLLITTSRWKNI